jgi:hypothetical protein
MLITAVTTVGVQTTTVIRIDPFHENVSEDVKKWIKTFELATTVLGWTDGLQFVRYPADLKGSARHWYCGVAKPNLMGAPTKWAEMKKSLRGCFLPYDYDSYLVQKLKNLTQGFNESCENFLNRAISLFHKIDSTTKDGIVMSSIIEGLKSEFRATVRTMRPSDLQDLRKACQIVERNYEDLKHKRSNFYHERKNFKAQKVPTNIV